MIYTVGGEVDDAVPRKIYGAPVSFIAEVFGHITQRAGIKCGKSIPANVPIGPQLRKHSANCPLGDDFTTDYFRLC